MKYNYKFNVLRYLLLLGILGIFSSSGLRAQGLSTNTTYVVNGSQDFVAPVDTFANLTGSATGPLYGAMSYLNQYGMNASQTATGQVTFLLSAGYNPVEPTIINIGQPTGAGGWPNMYWNANSPIVIKPAAGQSFNITTSSVVGANQALVRFNGAWYASIDGAGIIGQRNLSFLMPPSSTQTTSRVIDIMPTTGQRCQFVSVSNCNIVGNSNATATNTFAGVYFGGASAGTPTALGQNQNIDVINNYIIGVQNGIYFRGLASTVNLQNKFVNINNNIIGDYVNAYFPANTAFIGGSNGTGIYANAIANASISGNTIRNTVTTSANFKGIFLTSEGGSPGMSLDSNIQVNANTIYNLNAVSSGGVTGIRMNLGSHNQHLRILISNNSISKLSAINAQAVLNGFAYPIGILVEDVSSNVGLEVFFNSIYLTGSTLPANSFSACFATGAGTTGGIIMMNNSYANKMGRPITNVTAYTIYNVLTTSTIYPFRYNSYNNYYTATFDGGNAFVARLRNIDYTSLKGFQLNSRSDSTSYSSIPPFKNDSDLTVANGVSHVLYNSGANLTQFFNYYVSIFDSIRFKINTDIFGNSRSGFGRFTAIGCHAWSGDSTNNNVPLYGPRVFSINGFTSYPTALNLNGSFSTIAEAADYLNHYGTGGSGNVVLELAPGYNGETVHIPALIDYPGANLGRPVTFRTQDNFSATVSVPNNISLNNLSILRFMGAKWVTFDGGSNKGLSFVMPSNATNTNTRIIGITPVDTASNDITIRNCKLIGNSNTAGPNTGMGIYVGNYNISGAPAVALKTGLSFIRFIGNEISAVRSGIVFFSPGLASNALIKSNIIGGNIPTGTAANTTYIGGVANQCGIWVKGILDGNIDSNVVRNCVQTGANSNGFFGIYLDEPGGANFSGVLVTRNFIYNLVTATGTYCAGIRLNIGGGAPRGIQLINNFVGKVLGNGTGLNFSNLNPAGISIDATAVNSTMGIAMAHNTVNLTGTGLGANNSGSAALYLGANVQGGIELANNIFGNRINRSAGTGNRYAVLVGHSATPFTTNAILPFACNNNNYFATGNGNNFVGANTNGGVTRFNINNWRAFTAATPPLAGMDGNSFNWVNTFLTDTTPDISLLYGGLVPGGASIVTGVCTDIYGNARFNCAGGSTTVTRWVGAVEAGYPYPALQGNVTYPINGIDNPPTPSNPNSGSFKTVRNAVDYLNSQGVDDPNFGGFRTVRLEISAGYVGETDTFTQPITVLDFPRQSQTRPVVLSVAAGRNDTIKVLSNVNPLIAANQSLIRLSGCKYFTIDGNNGSGGKGLTLMLPSVFTANTNKVVDIISGFAPITTTDPTTTNNGIKNCNIVGNSNINTVYTYAGIYLGGLTTPSNSAIGLNGGNLFQNNFIGAVMFGIYLRGDGIVANMDNGNNVVGNIIGGNIAPNTTGNTNYFGGITNAAGIYIQSQTNANISGNTISNNIVSFSNPRGIELATIPVQAPVLSSVLTINGNTIRNIQSTLSGGAYGLYMNFGADNNNVNREITVSNNMISGIASPGTNASGTNFGLNPYGIYMNGTANIGSGNTYVGVYLYYNSINLGVGTNLTANGSQSACLGIPSYIRSGVISKNNIFQNRLSGNGVICKTYGVAIGGTTSPFYISDFNDYYTAATAPGVAANFASNASAAIPTTYNQWFEIMSFTLQDTLSLTSLAPFTNDNNLMIPATTSSNIYQAGKPIIGLTTDINGDPRNSFTPTLGAHEFNGTYIDDIAPRIFNVTDPTGCQSGPISLDFNIYDKLLSADSLYYRINGGAIQNVQASYSSGSFRRYIIPAQPSGTLIEFRVAAVDFIAPRNTGYFPAGKPWDTISTGITNFPYSNGFEGVNNPAWASQSLSGGAQWELGSAGSSSNPPLGAKSGVKSALFRSSTLPVGAVARLVSPCLDFTNLTSPTIRFYISQNSDLPAKRDSVQVKVSFGGNIWSNALKTVERVNNDFPLPGYKLVEVCLGAYKTSGLRIAIEGYSAGTGQNIQIDDIMIYDDVQNQVFTPKIFNSCLRDSIRLTVTNPDARFNYRVVNMATNQTLGNKMGDGSSMYIPFMSPVVDTLRFFVIATNTTSQAINTGFGGGFVTCSNIMPDTATAYINRYFNGPFLTPGTPFNGSFNVGDINNPDGSKIGDVITYNIVPPSFYTNSNYGTLWSLPNVSAVVQATGQAFTNFTFVAPSPAGPGYVRVTAPASMLDSNIVFNFTMRINASNCDSVFSRVLRVATPPVANFTFTPPASNLCALNNINFNALGSTLPSNNFPFTYTWLFGDNTMDFIQNPTKVYNAPGNYTVRFILTDRYGLSSEMVQNITVLPSPIVDYTTNVPCANDSTIFTPTTQPAGSIFLWTMPNSSTQTREVAKYNFAKYDTAYKVTLKITNTSGCFNTMTKNHYVFAKPTANFTTAPHCLSSNVPITNTSSIPTGVMGYNWTWGNGQNSLSATPTYKYPVSGTYTATLKVSSAFGCIDSMVKTVTVFDRPFTGFTVVNPCVGENDVTVFDNTTTFAGGSANVNYSWTFGDSKGSTAQSPSNKYQGIGTYPVFLLAVDKLNGCRDSLTRNVNIYYKPVAQFATSPETGICINNELKIVNTSYTIDQSLLNCNWAWGDGGTDSICNKNHTYTNHGAYTIKLIVSTANGCYDTATKDITAMDPPVLAIAVTDVDVASFPYCKNKKALSASILDAESYTWEMGDNAGSTRSGKDIEFVFSYKDTFTVKCTVKDLNGCTVVKTMDIIIPCGVGIQESMAAVYDLNAYPNPFGQSTNLSFELPKTADVKISVLDMLGRTIKTTDLGRTGAGKHNHIIEDFGAAGSYLIKVEIDGTAVYKQVIKQ